jgi:hypothetical protein
VTTAPVRLSTWPTPLDPAPRLAAAWLAAAVQDGSVQPGRRTVFVHTGGLPGLFGHPYAAQLAGELLARR